MKISDLKNMSMGYLLKLIRNSAQISQSAAAKKVYGIPQGNVSSLENDRIFPSIEHVMSAYYTMGYTIDLEDFLLDSWLNKLILKNPYNKVFSSIEELKKTIIDYSKKYPHFKIDKSELIRFHQNPTEYQLPTDAIHISSLVFDKDDIISTKLYSYDSIQETQELLSSINTTNSNNAGIIQFLEETIYNLQALLTLYQEKNKDQKNEIDNEKEREMQKKNSLRNWIEKELKDADISKLELLKSFWEKIK